MPAARGEGGTLGGMAKSDEPRPDDIEQLVRRYYALLNQLDPDLDALGELLGKKLTQVEHPNAVSPMGLRRGRRQLLADQAGGDVLTDQTFDVHDILIDGCRAAVRGIWQGTLAAGAGPVSAGTRLTAHVAAFITVKDGKIIEHETFECYESFGASGPGRAGHPVADGDRPAAIG